MITIKNLQYQHSINSKTFVYANVHCSVNSPLLITGQSGSGKTTLLHIIGGLLPNFKGSISINNTLLESLTTQQVDAFRGQNIGIVFQQHYFIQSLTVLENIKIAAAYKKPSPAFINQLTNSLNITHLLHKKTYQLSVGEQQRVAIAKALVKQPQLIIADEPTSSLDNQNAQAVVQLLLQQAHQNKACLIVVTHDERVKQHFTNTIQLSNND